jgi:hypothetical protein
MVDRVELRANPGISLPTRFVRAVTAVVVVSGAGVALLISGHGVPATIDKPGATAQPVTFAVGEHSAYARNRSGVDPWYEGNDRVGTGRLADHPGARSATLTSITNRSDHAVVVTRVTRADDEMRLVGIHLRSFSPTLPGLRSVLPVGYSSTFVPQRLAAKATVWLQLDYQTVGCPSSVRPGRMVEPGRKVMLFYRTGGRPFSTPIDVPGMPMVCGS